MPEKTEGVTKIRPSKETDNIGHKTRNEYKHQKTEGVIKIRPSKDTDNIRHKTRNEYKHHPCSLRHGSLDICMPIIYSS